jgi:hypothetical protein
MPDNTMLIIDAEIASRIDALRGGLSRSEYINVLIEKQLNEVRPVATHKFISRSEFQEYTSEIKTMLRNIFSLFIKSNPVAPQQPDTRIFQELTKNLQVSGTTGSQDKTIADLLERLQKLSGTDGNKTIKP